MTEGGASAQGLKLAIVRQRYNPYGGAERFVERALGALAATGARITLITRNWQGAPQEGFAQITCDPPYSRWLGGRAARDRSFIHAAQAAVGQGGFDLVQSHERMPGCDIFRAGDGVHGAWLDHRGRALGPLGRFLQRLAPYHRYVVATERAMFQHPALKTVICNSRMVADEVAHYYGVPREKLQVIYNGVDLAHFHPGLRQEHRAVLRQAQGWGEEPVLLFVGSGFERKGIPRLLQAMALMGEGRARLVVIGADRKLKTMEALAAKLGLARRVVFLGPQKDVRPWYGAADAFVLPTLYDPCPNAALEALACGLPSLVSSACGAKEWIVEGDNGFVVAPLDVPALASRLDALCRLAPAPSARDLARQSVQDLSLEAMSQRLLALYGSLLER